MVSFLEVFELKSSDTISCDCKQGNHIWNMPHHWDIHIYLLVRSPFSDNGLLVISYESTPSQADCTVEKFSLYLEALTWTVIASELWKYRAAGCCSGSGWTLGCHALAQENGAELGDESGVLLPVSTFPTVKVSGPCPHFAFFFRICSDLAGKFHSVFVSIPQLISQKDCVVLFVFTLFICSYTVEWFRWVKICLCCMCPSLAGLG